MVEVRPAHRPYRHSAYDPGRRPTAVGSASGSRGTNFARIFSSPLGRARRTAELAGFSPEIEPDLLEWNYGEYEGKTSTEIRAARPAWILFRDGCPGGESVAEVAERVDRLVGEAERYDRERPLLRARPLASRSGGAVGRPAGCASRDACFSVPRA